MEVEENNEDQKNEGTIKLIATAPNSGRIHIYTLF